jgi:hypothetical protein
MVDYILEHFNREKGDAISCNAREQNVSINGSSFLSCSATFGGGYFLNFSKCVISNCFIQECWVIVFAISFILVIDLFSKLGEELFPFRLRASSHPQ